MSPATCPRVCAALTAAALLACCVGAAAQTSPRPSRRSITAIRTATSPVLDGRLIDECWAQAQPASDFTQRDPDEGMPATERTEIRILYDDEAVYVAARLFDSQPELIERRLSSRDGDREADRITIYLDAMHDRLTGAIFGVSASNIQEDAIVSNDTFQDSSWDAVWQSSVAIDEGGWSVEIRIPLSQLRFLAADNQTWGINVDRFIRRKNETAWLEMVPKSEAGLASRMGDLTGLDGLRPRRSLELLPYAAARAEFVAPDDAATTFNDGSRRTRQRWHRRQMGGDEQPDRQRQRQSGFRSGRGRSGGGQPDRLRDVLSREAGVFCGGRPDFRKLRAGRANSFWGFNTSDPSIFYSRRIGRGRRSKPKGMSLIVRRRRPFLGRSSSLARRAEDGASVFWRP